MNTEFENLQSMLRASEPEIPPKEVQKRAVEAAMEAFDKGVRDRHARNATNSTESSINSIFRRLIRGVVVPMSHPVPIAAVGIAMTIGILSSWFVLNEYPSLDSKPTLANTVVSKGLDNSSSVEMTQSGGDSGYVSTTIVKDVDNAGIESLTGDTTHIASLARNLVHEQGLSFTVQDLIHLSKVRAKLRDDLIEECKINLKEAKERFGTSGYVHLRKYETAAAFEVEDCAKSYWLDYYGNHELLSPYGIGCNQIIDKCTYEHWNKAYDLNGNEVN